MEMMELFMRTWPTTDQLVARLACPQVHPPPPLSLYVSFSKWASLNVNLLNMCVRVWICVFVLPLLFPLIIDLKLFSFAKHAIQIRFQLYTKYKIWFSFDVGMHTHNTLSTIINYYICRSRRAVNISVCLIAWKLGTWWMIKGIR